MDLDKIDEATLALLYLAVAQDHPELGRRAWKAFDWETMERLHKKGLISNPIGKAKSVAFSEDGKAAAQAAFNRLFKELRQTT